MQTTLIQPATGPTVWRAPEYAGSGEWIHRLSPEALADIDRAMREVARKGLTLDSVGPEAFDLPALASDLGEIKRILAVGRGFVLIKGIGPAKYSAAELGVIAYGLGTHLGAVVSQNERGDRLGHVFDRGDGDPYRYYTRGGELDFHIDPVDIVGLFCLRPAMQGGESLIASAMAIHNAILDEHPEYMAPLYRGYHHLLNQIPGYGEGKPVTEHRVPVFAPAGDRLLCFYLPPPARDAVAQGYVAWTALERAAYDAVNEYARRPDLHFKMDFAPGDIQFLNNRTVLHARSDYRDHPDPGLKRHLYRLWMMAPDWEPRPANMQMRTRTDRSGGGIRPLGQ